MSRLTTAPSTDVEQRLAGVQDPGAAAHPLPAVAGLGGVVGLAERLAVELEQRVRADDERVGLLLGDRRRLGRGEQGHLLGDARRAHGRLVDLADHDLRREAGLAQQRQPGRGRRGQHEPAVEAHEVLPAARQPPGPGWRARRWPSA